MLLRFMFYARQRIPVLIVSFAILGILVAIVINRAADNLPAGRSVLETPRCPHCNMPRTLLEQFGILSFVLRRDRCHQCSAPLRLRAPLVEIATGALFAFLATRYAFGIYLVAICFFTAVLVLIAVIDLEHKLILNVVSLPGTLVALLASPLIFSGKDISWNEVNFNLIILSLIGMVVGYAITYGIYLLGFVFLQMINRGRTRKINTVAFGMGDVKLAGLLGALIGFPGIVYMLIYAVLLGGVGAAFVLVWQLIRRRGYALGMAIPYGPYLILAGWAFLVFRF
jgi:leader peptidase (prepilin peptidase) / N-methyltransferase